jgi:hypothetical protein
MIGSKEGPASPLILESRTRGPAWITQVEKENAFESRVRPQVLRCYWMDRILVGTAAAACRPAEQQNRPSRLGRSSHRPAGEGGAVVFWLWCTEPLMTLVSPETLPGPAKLCPALLGFQAQRYWAHVYQPLGSSG